MGNNIFSSGMEFLAIVGLIIIVLIVLAIFLFPTIVQVFNEFSWILGIGFIVLAFILVGTVVIIFKQLLRMV